MPNQQNDIIREDQAENLKEIEGYKPKSDINILINHMLQGYKMINKVLYGIDIDISKFRKDRK